MVELATNWQQRPYRYGAAESLRFDSRRFKQLHTQAPTKSHPVRTTPAWVLATSSNGRLNANELRAHASALLRYVTSTQFRHTTTLMSWHKTVAYITFLSQNGKKCEQGPMMLLEFSLRNYFSFKEGAKISFRVNEHCPDEFKSSNGNVLLMGIKGANGSGKTNVLRAIRFLGIFCANSFLAEPDGPIGVKQFFGSKKPSEFSVEFLCNDIKYQYDLKLDNDRVHYESLYRKLKRKTKLFERINDDIVWATEEYSGLKAIKLRSNASIVSIAHNHKLELMDDIYYYFACWNGNVTYKGLSEVGPSIYKIAERLNDRPDDLDFIRNFIVECDGGVSDIDIRKVEREDGETVYVPVFIHESSGKPHKVSHITESSGTKSLFKYLLHYRMALETGGLLILDEFDINLHPHILPKLLALFSSSESNPYNAQMIFSTHNGEILDSLGRYRCYLVNKEDNESYAYRLDEIPGETLRNDRSITHAYNRGDIGGVPRI